MSRGRRMRPSPAVQTPAVAMKSAFPALGSAPLTRTWDLNGTVAESFSSRSPSSVRAERVRLSYVRGASDSTTWIADDLACAGSTASAIELSLAMTAARAESDWNWVTMREKAATDVANAPADWVITPNSILPAMYAGTMIKTGMIWIIQL